LKGYERRIREVALVPSTGGAFEVSVDGNKVYSKLETGRFPDERALIKELSALL